MLVLTDAHSALDAAYWTWPPVRLRMELLVHDSDAEELGPIDYVVVEFPTPTRTLAGAMATELASLVDAELIRVIDLVVIDKRSDGTFAVTEFEDLVERDALGDLRALDGQLADVLALEDLERVVDVLRSGTTAAIVVWENSWAAPFAVAARRSGGELIANGRIPTQAVVDALAGGPT